MKRTTTPTRVTCYSVFASVAWSLVSLPVVQARDDAPPAPAAVLCGIDVLARDGFKPLHGRKVALVTGT